MIRFVAALVALSMACGSSFGVDNKTDAGNQDPSVCRPDLTTAEVSFNGDCKQVIARWSGPPAEPKQLLIISDRETGNSAAYDPSGLKCDCATDSAPLSCLTDIVIQESLDSSCTLTVTADTIAYAPTRL